MIVSMPRSVRGTLSWLARPLGTASPSTCGLHHCPEIHLRKNLKLIYLAASALEVFSNWALYKLTYSYSCLRVTCFVLRLTHEFVNQRLLLTLALTLHAVFSTKFVHGTMHHELTWVISELNSWLTLTHARNLYLNRLYLSVTAAFELGASA